MPSATIRPRTLSDVLLPRPNPQATTRYQAAVTGLLDALLIVLFSGIVALSAQVAIPLPFTPVPITGQTFGVLFTGAVLGSRKGALALLLYLLEGAAGLPVFAPGGAIGWPRLLGPTAGYLWAYPFAAGMVGWLAERGWDRRLPRSAVAMLLGNLIIWAFGVAWLTRFVGGPGNALLTGLLPFLPGDLLKIALAALLLPGSWALVRRLRGGS